MVPPMTHDMNAIPLPSERPTLTITEAARYLGLSRSAAYRAANNGTIPVLRLSPQRMVVPTAGLRRLLELDAAQGAA